MNDIIKLLPDHVANQIAAGEVVQRPASVVKELLENAIDAGASSIQLLVENAGGTLVQVIDNGKGMSTTDARLSFERHATSKISTTADIFSILTKGFRGEALASIAAVAQVELQTKRPIDELGVTVVIEGSKVVAQDPSPVIDGTNIVVKNLFFNVPARRNFLKSNAIEFKHILDEYHRVALAHENIEFKLIHNGGLVYHNRPGSFLQRILQIFGQKQEGFLTPVKEETHLIQVEGFVGKPDISRKTKGMQFLFVNNRFIKSPFLHKAISQAYDNLLPQKSYPAYFLKIEIDPQKIDINIHPTKTEVKFDNESMIYGIINAAVKRSLGKFQVKDALDFDSPLSWQPSLYKEGTKVSPPQIQVDKNYNPFVNNTYKKNDFLEQKELLHLYAEQVSWDKDEPTELLLQKNEAIKSQFIQWENTYLVTTREDILFIIDQHRAHQTILYHAFISQLQENTISQQLLFPIEIPIDIHDKLTIELHENQLFNMGFDFEMSNEFIHITAIPSTLKTEDINPLFLDFFQEGEAIKSKTTITGEEKICRVMAKSCAIKKGTKLEVSEINNLINQFFEISDNKYSPYGKKNYLCFDKSKILKDF